VLTLIATIVVLSVLILVHEFGHFFAAKSVDIAVPRFSLGLGPKVVGFRIGETEYVLSALPLGGYVKMAGMEEAEMLEGGPDVEREPSPRDFETKPVWARAWVLSAGVIMNFLFAGLLFAALALVYGESIDPTTRVVVLDPAESAENTVELAKIPAGAEIVAVGDVEVDSRDDITRALAEAPAGPVRVRFSESPPVTLQVPAGDSARLALLGALQPLYPPVIGEVVPGTPAAAGNLRAGDRIVSAGGAPVSSWAEFVRVIRRHAGEPLALEIERNGQPLSLSVTPDAEREGGRLGVFPEIEIARRTLGPGQAVVYGAQATWFYSKMIVDFLGNLFTGEESPRSVGSLLTIGQVSGQAARLGLEPFLRFMGIFSINLAVLNLLPIPILDGGHLLFLGIEALRGRPLSLEQRLRLSHVGLIIVVGIMVWAMTNDVLRFLGI
jgi:regulator of sigma E protease